MPEAAVEHDTAIDLLPMTHSTVPRHPAAMFVSHGGGPLPVFGDPGHREMVVHLGNIASGIQKPSGIVVVSAHWEASEATITAHSNPPVIYDYYGFPPESCSLEYPAPGDPEEHIRIGAVLAELSRDNILVLGSGFSFHNLKVFMGGDSSGLDLGTTNLKAG